MIIENDSLNRGVFCIKMKIIHYIYYSSQYCHQLYVIIYIYIFEIISNNSMTDSKDLNRLKVILAEKKKSNLWLSRELGCAPTTVSKWCTNTSQPPLEMLMKISKLLNVELSELVRFEELENN